MPEDQDQLYAGITDTLKKHGIGLPATPTARPASEITAPPPKDELLSGIQETLKKHGIGAPGSLVPVAPAQSPQPAGPQQVPPVATSNQPPEPGTPPSAPVAPAAAASPAGVKPPEPEIVPGFGGQPRRSIPFAPAPTKSSEPSLPGEVVIGAKESLANHVSRWASLIDPASFMSGSGVDPNTPEARAMAEGVPETRQGKLEVAQKAMTAGLFPEGEPAPAANVGRGVLRGIGGAPVALTELAMLSPLAGPAAGIAKGAITFALQGLTGEKPIEGAVHGAALGAILGINHQLAGKIADPVVQWLAKIAGGMTIGGGATALAGGGAQDIARDSIIFGLFEVMGMPRGKKAEVKPGEWKVDWDWMEKQKVSKEIIDRLKYEPTDSPEFVQAVNDASSSLFGKTPQPETPTPEAQKAAIFGGKLGETIEGQGNRADAIKALVPIVGDQARAERFHDLYEKGDAVTALKEFPEFSAMAPEAQRRVAITPAERGEGPAPMQSSGAAAETAARTAPVEAAAPPRAAEDYIAIRKLVSKVELAGDPAAAKRLDDLAKANPGIANLLRTEDTTDWSRREPILSKMSGLMRRIEETGDPNAVKELSDYIAANPKTLEGFPRWPAEVTPAATEMVSKGMPSVNPAGRSNEVPESLPKETPPAGPRFSEPAANEPPSGAHAQPGGAGNVGISPTPAEAPKKRGALVAPKPGLPDQPMGMAGSARPEVAPAPAEATPDPLQAAKDFRKNYGSNQGAPEGLLTGNERMIPGETPSPRTPGISYHEAFPRADIQLNPDVWQHKIAETGAGQALAHVKNRSEWDAEAARGLSLYRYPDGHVELMDGHSRITAGDRVGVQQHGVRIYDGNAYSVEEARTTAALTNIRLGTGTVVDSAKAMRDFGLTPESLREKGIDLNGEHTRIALGLSNLSDEVFTLVARGDFPAKKGAIIGEQLPGNFEAQNAIYKMIQKKHTDKNGVISISDDKLKNDIRFAEFSKVTPTKQATLGLEFDDFVKENLVSENSDLMTYATRKLASERSLFKTVNAKAARLVAAGNELKPDVNQKISDDAAMGLAILDKAAFIPGSETNKLFKEFALQLQESKAKSQVKDEFYVRLPEALEADRDAAGLGQGVAGGVREEVPTSAAPGESQTGEGFGLSSRETQTSKLETRLDQIQADYPGADRDRVAQVIRALPNAEDGQVVNMAADPEMFAQVARGNLAASEKAQLLKKASDAGAQGDLFGGGERGGDTLFKVGEEAALARGLTTDQIQGRLGKFGTVSELGPDTFPAESPYARGWTMRFKNGQLAMVFEAKDSSLKIGPGESLGSDYSALGVTSLEGKTIAGSFKPMSVGSIIELARGEGVRTFDHESWHHIEHWLLNDKERAALARDFGDNEEVRAEAYANWKPKEAPNTVFQKILDFFQRITKAITGYQTGEDVFAKARSGELFAMEPAERGALVAPKYRAAQEGGEWAMDGGLAGRITGNARAAREEGKAAKSWLMNLFASNRTSKEALKTHQIIAGSQAESATEKLRMQNIFMKYVDGMGPIKGPETQEFLRLYESGQEAQITHPIFKAFAEEFRAEERRHMEIMTMLGDAPKEIPNYIDHLWKENEAREKIKAQLNAQVTGGRSMRGPDYYKLLRTVVDIPSGIAQGLEPKFDTLPEVVLAGRSARENRIAATKRLKFIKENGYEKVVRDIEGGTYTVTGADGKDQTFRSINEARRFATDNPGSSDPQFEPAVPQGWKVYPGGYGEVWAKIQRRAGLMVPEKADEETMPLGGGPERMGYEEVPKVNAWSRVGYRVGPEDVVRQFEDFLGRGLSGNTAFEIYQSGLHAVRHSQMALSFFHAFFESINSVATHAGGGIFDSLGGLFTGDWKRMGGGLKTLAASPLAPFTDIKLGLNINKTLMENGIGIPGEATNNQLLKDARTLVGGGMRPEVESKLVKILSNHFKEAWKLKGVSTGKAANELLQGLSSPTMEVIVPFSKQGSTMFNYLAEVKRWERDNPGVAPTEADLRSIAYQCRETSDHIYGRMAKDNVAMNGMVKSLLTGVLQFPTWQFGTVSAGVRTVLGAKTLMGKVFDMMQGKEIRQLAMKDRQVLQYVTGVLFTVGMTGALMTYALTGKKPETMADYFFPKTGEINPNGSEERLQLPSYFKDAMGFSKHPFKTIGAKLASPIHILTDLIQNKDYWGNQVYDPHDWIGQRGIDVLKYMAKTTAPFALQSYEQGAKGGPGRFAMSLFGVRPVPRETSNSPAANVIDEYNQMMRASTTTKESAETKKLKSDLMKLARDQDETGFQEAASQSVSEGKITRQQVKEIVGESQVPPGMTRFTKLPLEWATRAFDAGSDYEKEQWKPYYLKKVMAEKPENLIKNRKPVVATLREMGLDDAADAVDNLVMPEEPLGGIDMAGLGLVKPAPEMAGMEEVDVAIAAALEQNLTGKPKRVSAMVRPPSTREKKKPYNVIGL